MFDRLLSQDLTQLRRRVEALGVGARLRLLLVVGGAAALAAHGLYQLWLARLAQMADPAHRRAELLAGALRLGVLLAAWGGLSSFSQLWRDPNAELLGRLPLPPRDLFYYRLTRIAAVGLAPLTIAALALLRAAPLVEGSTVLAGLAVLVSAWALALIWGLHLGVIAAASVVDEALTQLKKNISGGVTVPDRALLLYTPMAAAAVAFFGSWAVLVGAQLLWEGSAAGWVGLATALGLVVEGGRRARASFEARYYLAAAAMADGELLHAEQEAAPSPEYFGQSWAQRMPAGLRPFVEKDLRQSWRLSRLTPWLLLGGGGAVALVGARIPLPLDVQVGALVLLAVWEAAALAGPGRDHPDLWARCPGSLRDQYLGRLAAASFYPLLVAPGACIALMRGGEGAAAVGGALLSALLLAGVGVHSSLRQIGAPGGAVPVLLAAALWLATTSSPVLRGVACGALFLASAGWIRGGLLTSPSPQAR